MFEPVLALFVAFFFCFVVVFRCSLAAAASSRLLSAFPSWCAVCHHITNPRRGAHIYAAFKSIHALGYLVAGSAGIETGARIMHHFAPRLRGSDTNVSFFLRMAGSRQTSR